VKGLPSESSENSNAAAEEVLVDQKSSQSQSAKVAVVAGLKP